jgi:hypothetical protein
LSWKLAYVLKGVFSSNSVINIRPC